MSLALLESHTLCLSVFLFSCNAPNPSKKVHQPSVLTSILFARNSLSLAFKESGINLVGFSQTPDPQFSFLLTLIAVYQSLSLSRHVCLQFWN
jgi:hypothetical protein